MGLTSSQNMQEYWINYIHGINLCMHGCNIAQPIFMQEENMVRELLQNMTQSEIKRQEHTCEV